MDIKTLTDIGLNETQAKAYLVLIKSGSITPPLLAEKIKVTRTNAYAVLDQIVELGLAKKMEVKKKIVYQPDNPIALEKLAKENRQRAMEQEKTVQSAMPTLLNYFHTFSDQPGIRFFQGLEGIKEIYNDILRTGKDIYLIRSPHDQDLMTLDYYIKYKERRAKQGIKTYMLNSSTDHKAWNETTDRLHNIERTPIRSQDYTSEVEISTYGNKTAIISFGEEVMGMIIESPQTANAIRQIFQLAKAGAQAIYRD